LDRGAADTSLALGPSYRTDCHSVQISISSRGVPKLRLGYTW
jgi:hypothetical protein